MIKYIFLVLALVYASMTLVCYEYDDEGDPFAPPVENMTKKTCAKGEVCYHEDYYGQNIRGCRNRTICPSNITACVGGVCCCTKNLCNTEQPPPAFTCYSGQARIEEDPETSVGRAPCHSWCVKEYKVEAYYNCTTDYRCKNFKNKCGHRKSPNGLSIYVCCCKGNLCNRRFEGDPPFVSFEEETTETTTATTTKIVTTMERTTTSSSTSTTTTTSTSATKKTTTEAPTTTRRTTVPSTSTGTPTSTTKMIEMEPEKVKENRGAQEKVTKSPTPAKTTERTQTTTTMKSKEVLEYRQGQQDSEVVKGAAGVKTGAVLVILFGYGFI